MEVFSAAGSFFGVSVYIVSTYLDQGISWMENIDLALMVIYLFEFLLKVFASQHRIVFIFSVWSLVELATIAPLFFL